MRCPKCGLNSFDHNETCPGCGRDLTPTRAALGLITVAPQPVSFLGPILPDEGDTAGQPLDEVETESLGAYQESETAPPERVDEPGKLEEAGTLEFEAAPEPEEVKMPSRSDLSGEIEFDGELASSSGKGATKAPVAQVDDDISLDLSGETDADAEEASVSLDALEADDELDLDLDTDLDISVDEPAEADVSLEEAALDETVQFEDGEDTSDFVDIEFEPEEAEPRPKPVASELERTAENVMLPEEDELDLTDLDLDAVIDQEALAESDEGWEIDDLDAGMEEEYLDEDISDISLDEMHEDIAQMDRDAQSRILDTGQDQGKAGSADEADGSEEIELVFDDLEMEDDKSGK